jgi:uncharacterized cupredoxin-like copper-binding protein
MFKRFLLLSAIVLLGGISYAHARAADATVVKATEEEYRVNLSSNTIPVGTPVRFEVTNKGKIQHEFVIERAGGVDDALEEEREGQEVDAEIEAFNPGQTKTLEWTFTQPGAYQVACHIPGHFEAGMEATFTVAAGDAALLPTAGGIWSAPFLALAAVGAAVLAIGLIGFIGFVRRKSDTAK